eukprot:CAMPEP_0201722910 /NCGR_PEP_ID=MMETSP0593-20130828/7114_1 /ASSEMBLY_ACC=CAM_ASM_000672 /TAXON_ID=267983 /ORGANISM="Skeletonema japonicum, Strain CCMP2506" /LENGTH=571 /DNA_ID=CAMNT_0048213921 /DNA_START=41 /DNA_END=1756 /DNA_ORIENTATION=+
MIQQSSRRSRYCRIRIILLCCISAFLLVLLGEVLLLLPGHVDKFLLTDTNYCCLERTTSGHRVSIDGLKHSNGGRNVHERVGQHGIYHGLLQRVVDSLTWKLLVLNHKAESDDDTCQLTRVGTNHELEPFLGCHQLHPICKDYRTLRTRVRVQKLILPWNWYYRTEFKLSGLALHAFKEDIRFVNKTDETTWRLGTIVRRLVQSSLASYDAAQIYAIPSSKESASLHIESADFSFQSWRYPVVSAHLNQISINVIIQKDENRLDDKLLVGDMKIPELLKILPKPPELEGVYPRIGVVNITNVTLNVYEGRGSGDSSSLNMLMKVTLPDQLFSPITNLTLANSPSGIDRKHFQPLLEAAVSNSIRQHLLREAEKAFHNSLTTTTEFTKQLKDRTNRAQEQLQLLHQYLLKRQDMHFDHWWEIIVQGWHHTQESIWHGVMNGTVPILAAVGAWVEDVKQTPPLALLVSHHWDKLLSEVNNNIVSIDQHVWRHINELELAFDGLVAKATGKDVDHVKYNVPIEKRIANQLDKLKDSFDDLVAKSGGNIERLLQSCEDEMKDKWMDWHKQFFPEL